MEGTEPGPHYQRWPQALLLSICSNVALSIQHFCSVKNTAASTHIPPHTLSMLFTYLKPKPLMPFLPWKGKEAKDHSLITADTIIVA